MELQWACLLLEQVGERSLEHLPLVMSAFAAVDDLPQLAEQQTALRNLRSLPRLRKLRSRESVSVAVQQALRAEVSGEYELAYEINAGDLTFARRETHMATLAHRAEQLARPWPAETHGLTLAPANEELFVRFEDQGEVHLRIPANELPPPPAHHELCRERAPLRFTIDDLVATGTSMDVADAHAGRPDRDWAGTIRKLRLRVRGDAGFTDDRVLDLGGLRHLIGLPGAGKTTLVQVLCVYLARHDRRVAVFVPAIEVARQQLEVLERYLDPADVALLAGRGQDTHAEHADRVAQVVAAQDADLGGFGLTVAGVDRFARGCALRAYATTDEETTWQRWGPAQRPPCENVLRRVTSEGGRTRDVVHLCPLWSRCGRVHNHAQLVTARVWLGHVISSTASVPAHTSARRLSYAELLPDAVDLVIVDEADDAQASLDRQAMVKTPLFGKGGLHRANQLLSAVYLPAVHAPRATTRYMGAALELEGHVQGIVDLIRAPQSVELAGKLLTTRAFVDHLAGQADVTLTTEARNAFAQVWETAVHDMIFGRDTLPVDAPRLALQLGLGETELQRAKNNLREGLRRYRDQEDSDAALAPLRQGLAELLGVPDDGHTRWDHKLLVMVSLVVASFKKLRTLAVGVDLSFKHTYLPDDGARGLGHFAPTSLLGNFAALSYLKTDRIQIEQIILGRATRLLPERLARAGVNVLLTSATSYLPSSSSYHLHAPPDYLLLPQREGRDAKLTLRFTPREHTDGRAIRVSGAGGERDERLRLVIREMARRQNPVNPLGSQLERDLAHVAANLSPVGRPRKAALVVNSYDQVLVVLDALKVHNPNLHARAVGLTRARVPGRNDLVLRAEIEAAAQRDDLSVLVFPMGAIGRGVNMVLGGSGEEKDLAAIGVMYFLVRPHPTVGDTTLLHSLVNRATERFDQHRLGNVTLADARAQHRRERARLYRTIRELLERPQQASQLPGDALEAFTANLVVPVWQTIGRTIRGGADAEIHFVDAAWAGNSADGKVDRPRTSVLVGMQLLLDRDLRADDPAAREVSEALYGNLVQALRSVEGLRTDKAAFEDHASDFTPFTDDGEPGEEPWHDGEGNEEDWA
ncbi:hypothetical protein C8263_12410 [Deinococcus arcticus]|uniref:pPIWI-RE three-gene island domain-containing protein n=2 Tax=Deinococcus arcticus TaxID=2136176 RepID=A0A2T3W6J4_9DEIO|nr:hypothetical protein [Deinococcus arcticus]PTA67373.1 hypothetical protein C8263_12410 [Deinococcus arcticus]